MKIKMKKQAFTLSEVLIALTVIGVIAAITVPALIQKTQKQEYVSALKKAYSTLSQVTQQIIAEEGTPKGSEGGWASNLDALFNTYKKHLSNVKECTNNEKCFFQHGEKGYKWLDNSGNDVDFDMWRTLILSDGMQLMFQHYSHNCSGKSQGSDNICEKIFVDINGAKEPNQWGRDVFTFIVKEDGGLYPAGCDYDACLRSAYHSSAGQGCACKVLREGAMNY